VIVYLVLAAQFESFVHPIVILTTVPLALFGAFIALWPLGMTLNVYSQIGIVMLVGLSAKNGILIVEFANQRRRLRGAPDPGRGDRVRRRLLHGVHAVHGPGLLLGLVPAHRLSRAPRRQAARGGWSGGRRARPGFGRRRRAHSQVGAQR
jgi:Cu/Ag efflux pump CusA